MSTKDILEKCERDLYFNTLRALAHSGDKVDRNPPIGEPKPLTPDHLRGVLQSVQERHMETTRIYMATKVFQEFSRYYRKDLEMTSKKEVLMRGMVAKFEGVDVYSWREVPEYNIYLIVGIPDDGEIPSNGVWVNMGGVVRVQIVSEF